jgi:biopolymer transport protein ExbD
MRFYQRKRRQPPAIIIVSLIDILIVLLIFMMVTTTFKQFPSVKINLPESLDGKPGSTETETVVITLPKEGPPFFLGTLPMTFEALQAELNSRAVKSSNAIVSIRLDVEVPSGRYLDVLQAIQKAGFTQKIRMFKAAGVRPRG